MMIEGVSDDFRQKVIRYAVSYSLISKAIQAVFDREVTIWRNRPTRWTGFTQSFTSAAFASKHNTTNLWQTTRLLSTCRPHLKNFSQALLYGRY
jgi:hypothetical protein